MSLDRIALASPIEMQMSLSQTLGRRRSRRDMSDAPLDGAILSALLWAGAGLTDASGVRTAPSARGCKAVDIYVVNKEGAWFYDAAENALEKIAEGDLRGATTCGQAFVETAPVTLLFVADVKKAQGLTQSRVERSLALDAGCMLQNTLLAASAMGLCAVPRANFDRAVLQKALHLDENEKTVIVTATFGFPQ